MGVLKVKQVTGDKIFNNAEDIYQISVKNVIAGILKEKHDFIIRESNTSGDSNIPESNQNSATTIQSGHPKIANTNVTTSTASPTSTTVTAPATTPVSNISTTPSTTSFVKTNAVPRNKDEKMLFLANDFLENKLNPQKFPKEFLTFVTWMNDTFFTKQNLRQNNAMLLEVKQIYKQMTQKLVDEKYNFNIVDEQGKTLLSHILALGDLNADFTYICLNSGINCMYVDPDNNTYLHKAIEGYRSNPNKNDTQTYFAPIMEICYNLLEKSLEIEHEKTPTDEKIATLNTELKLLRDVTRKKFELENNLTELEKEKSKIESHKTIWLELLTMLNGNIPQFILNYNRTEKTPMSLPDVVAYTQHILANINDLFVYVNNARRTKGLQPLFMESCFSVEGVTNIIGEYDAYIALVKKTIQEINTKLKALPKSKIIEFKKYITPTYTDFLNKENDFARDALQSACEKTPDGWFKNLNKSECELVEYMQRLGFDPYRISSKDHVDIRTILLEKGKLELLMALSVMIPENPNEVEEKIAEVKAKIDDVIIRDLEIEGIMKNINGLLDIFKPWAVTDAGNGNPGFLNVDEIIDHLTNNPALTAKQTEWAKEYLYRIMEISKPPAITTPEQLSYIYSASSWGM